jgi:predicted DCC family thiol-disulfide oxidoreductase YuxK
MNKIWNTLFLEERPSIGLSFFRIFVALTVGLHVIPSFFHLDDNYLSTAFKTYNTDFFPVWFIEWVQKSPDALVIFFAWAFCITCFCFFIGLFSQISCILMTACCYYFYALNCFHIGTLSWDILLVTLFLMCVTPYHGDYFSIDALRRGDTDSWRRLRPFFIQRLLQLQIGSMFFFTGLYKITGEGNWITGNPIYYLMNYSPVQGVTKNFILKEWMAGHSTFCYVTGLMIVATEMSMPFFLFIPRTRRAAIILGLFWHILLVLTLDVPAIFLFLFPAQMMLFIHPQRITDWIEAHRRINAQGLRAKIIYDGDCGFCRASIRLLQVMDLWGKLQYIPGPKGMNEMKLYSTDDKIYGGFFAFRQLVWILPMLYPMIVLVYFPGAGILGPLVYRWVARNRYVFPVFHTCADGQCHL